MEATGVASIGKIMNQRQYRIPGGTEEINATIEGWKDAGTVVSFMSPFSFFYIWQKTHGL